jgi:hypothetical protein
LELKEINNIVKHFIPTEEVIAFPEQNWIRAQNQWTLFCSLKG